MPSLRAVRSFVAAAKHQNFTRAAEALCVTQAAISRQVRELEEHLGAELFVRVGRAVELTTAGSIFFDAARLSFVNISEAAERIRGNNTRKRSVTICCSPAFSALWLSPRLPGFFRINADIELSLIATQNFLGTEPGVLPDIYITKIARVGEAYRSQSMFHDVTYPVCSPRYLQEHPELRTLEGMRDGMLLNLSPYGRSQLAEHVDWNVWFGFFAIDMANRSSKSPGIFNSNDYNVLVHQAIAHQGVSLGWNHLVGPLVEKGLLTRPVEQEVVHEHRRHFLNMREDKETDAACCRVRDWLMLQV